MPSPSRPSIGFAVLYRWRVHPGAEAESAAAWRRLTHAIRDERGGLGSRLHRLEDGWHAAYAQWPSRDAWEAARDLPSPDPEASDRLSATIAERLPPLELHPVDDLLE